MSSDRIALSEWILNQFLRQGLAELSQSIAATFDIQGKESHGSSAAIALAPASDTPGGDGAVWLWRLETQQHVPLFWFSSPVIFGSTRTVTRLSQALLHERGGIRLPLRCREEKYAGHRFVSECLHFRFSEDSCNNALFEGIHAETKNAEPRGPSTVPLINLYFLHLPFINNLITDSRSF